MPGGRPSSYDPELADEICERLAAGESLLHITQTEQMPDDSTIYRWLFKFPEFCEKYTRAREAQSDVYADQLIDIADSCDVDQAAVAKARLQSDNRKWIASKLKPKKYGDATLLKHADPDGNKLTVEIEHVKPKK